MGGFGRSKFGRGPFGLSDTGNDLVVQSFPTEYFDDTLTLPPGQTLTDNTIDPLLLLLFTYANSVLQRRLQIEALPTLLDPDSMPLDLVFQWGEMLGLGIDRNDPEFLQRSFLKTASQWLQIKASTKGYEVRGLASGFKVEVDNFWRIDPSYESLFPARFLYFLKPTEADSRAVAILHTDQPPGTFAGTPTVEGPTYAKSAYVRVVFSVPIFRSGVDYNTLLDLVIYKIRDVVGIHQELTAPQYLVIMNVSLNITATILEIDEAIAPYSFGEACYFDIIPGDAEPVDSCLGSGFFMETMQGITMDLGVSGTTSLVPEETILPGSLNAVPSIVLDIDNEQTTNMSVSGFSAFTLEPEELAQFSVSGMSIGVSGTPFIQEQASLPISVSGSVIISPIDMTNLLNLSVSGSVSGTTSNELAQFGTISVSGGLSITQIQEFWSVSIASVSGITLEPIEQTDTIPDIQVQNYFDAVPGDTMPLDGTIGVSIQVS